jgi:hypothetical protein
MLNRYLDRLERFVKEYQGTEPKHFEGPGGKPAKLNDLIWYHIDPNSGRRTRYLCGVHGRKGRGNAGSRPTDALRYPYDCLIKIWIMETLNNSLSACEKQSRTSVARKLLTLMKGDLYAQSEATIRSLNLGAKATDRLRPFIVFCAEKGLMPAVKLESSDGRDRTGDAYLQSTQEKLPNVESILALGSIFSTLFVPAGDDGLASPSDEMKMHDALVVTFALLSLASPNRMSAEIPLLPKQRLHSYAEGGAEAVYYLDWIGSKGNRNNKNHMLAALAEPVQKVIDFFYEACEPARVLCRFYENPKQSFKVLLGDFKVAPELSENLSLAQPPNLFTLGYALGFYHVDGCVPVLREGADLASVYHSRRGALVYKKPIFSLRAEDLVTGSRVSHNSIAALPHLFGYAILPKVFGDDLSISVGEVQERWISFYKRNILPEFPLAFSSGESRIRLKDAMFCFLGSWLYGDCKKVGGSGKLLQKTKYAVVPLASLGASVTSRLSGRNAFIETIFESYGFPSELRIKPHSLRHFSNTLADLSAIPVEITAAWSGRRSIEQTHTYIHTSHEEKVSRVSAIINSPVIDKANITVVSQEKLIRAANLPASLTSTGICTQNLNVTPCNYLNDFASQCFMCPETCHVAGDDKAIKFLERDLLFQSRRLESVSSDPRLSASQAMKQWYVVHSRNTHLLSLLIDLMRTSAAGTMVRYVNATSEFKLTDLNTMIVTTVASALPNHDDALKALISSQNASSTIDKNPQLTSLLLSFGLGGGES